MAMDPKHPYRNINLGPGDVPFELRPSPGKGWGVFATRKIIPGDKVLTEKPLIVVRRSIRYINQAEVVQGLQQLSPSQKQQVKCLTEGRVYLAPIDLFRENEFLVSNDPPAHGMYTVLSRFNHSCVANCRIPKLGGENDELTIQACKTIMPGQELTFSYDPVFQYLTAPERARWLDFECKCPACLTGTLFHQASNMRRTLIRGLFFLVHGRESEPDMPRLRRPILTDPEMIKQAKDLTIPLSTRFIAVLLMAFLLEEEEMMDPAMAASLLPSMTRLSVTFRSARNAQIASNAMKHQSFLGRFCEAFKLYGKKDLADRELAVMLQKKRRDGLL